MTTVSGYTVDKVQVYFRHNVDEPVDVHLAGAYLTEALKHNSSRTLSKINIEFDGEYANVTYYYKSVPFKRIRRITGYLVGDTSRWNSGKTAELNDRVTHGSTGVEPHKEA